MENQTPQFDKALGEYFAKLKLDEKGGQWRICRFSGEKFYVRPEDVGFYKKIRVPLPTLSPEERSRRRMAFSPSYNFFKVKSAISGKSFITVYPPTTPFKIYEHKIWFSDEWDSLSFGMIPAGDNSFFTQFQKLQSLVPRPNLNTDSSNVNSDYTNNSINLKNCYLTVDSIGGENLYYFDCCQDNKDCVDCWAVSYSDTCYHCWGERLFKCFFVHHSENCLESYFLFDCRNCQYCFMCSNLRNKKYYFFNTQLSQDEYEAKLKQINLGDYSVFQEYFQKFQELGRNAIRRAIIGEQNVNSSGAWMWRSKDCFYVIYCDSSERIAYSLGFFGYRDSYDITGGTNSELCYEQMTIASENNYGVKFSSFINNSRDLEYCDLVRNCHDCFGCIGLVNKSFCILNKQYTENDYWKIVDEIKTAMLERGEYGEFFPPELSPFPYNFSLATAYPGYSDLEEARRYGYRIEEVPEQMETIFNIQIISSSRLPPDIKDVDDSILEKVILDGTNNKKFRITPYELNFYRKYNLPLPRIHPVVRMNQWRKNLDLRFRFYERPCIKCGQTMKTSYAPDRPEKNIYCESCYLKEVV